MNVPGIPDVITREAAIGLINSLGLSVDHLVALSFQRYAIVAEVYSLDPGGNMFVQDDDTVATHHISIKIVDEDES